MADITTDEVDRRRNLGKARPKGTLPFLPDDLGVEVAREWLTRAFRPRPGWRVEAFERPGKDRDHPCSLTLINGREHRKYRFRAQSDLATGTRLRTTVLGVSEGALRMPHLTATEAEDVWAALCVLGRALSEEDELEQADEWLRMLLDATVALEGHSLVADQRRDALLALREIGTFSRLDALAIVRQPTAQWPRRPLCLTDKHTRERWLRAGEAATFLRYIVGVQPLKQTTLDARWKEIGVERRYFQDYRPPHPKARLYCVPEGLDP
jgi:hypothetical protein